MMSIVRTLKNVGIKNSLKNKTSNRSIDRIESTLYCLCPVDWVDCNVHQSTSTGTLHCGQIHVTVYFWLVTGHCLATHSNTAILLVQGIIYLLSHRNLLRKIRVLRCIVVFVPLKMCEACMLDRRVIMQAWRWVCRNCYTRKV